MTKRPALLAGAAALLNACSTAAPPPARALPASTSANTTVSPEGIVRTTLESHTNEDGDETRLVLTTYPPGVSLAAHHHPSFAFNYVLEGTAESQYAGEPLRRFEAGDTFQDKAGEQHVIFRNADGQKPLVYLIVYSTKKGQPFLVIP